MRVGFLAGFVLSAVAAAVLGAPNAGHIEGRDDSSSDDGTFTKPLTSGTKSSVITSKPNYPTLGPELSSLLSEEATFLTLPPSILSVLKTAVPTGVNVADGCVLGGSKLPDWFGKLPKDVQSFLTSYQASVSSWYTAHSTQLGALSSYVAELSSYDVGYIGKSTGVLPTISACSVLAVQTAGVYPTKTKNMAPAPTAAVAAGLAGVVGVLGIVAAL